MAGNNLLFMTDGTWDGTSVVNNNRPLSCRRIYLDLQIFNTENGEAGIDEGGSLEGYVDYVAVGADETAPDAALTRGDIFPGSIELQVKDKCVRVVCEDPELNFLSTRVFLDDLEITEDVAKVYASVDAIADNVNIWLKYKTGEQFGLSQYDNLVLI